MTVFNINTHAMKTNMGNTDKIVRTVIAALFAVLYFTDVVSGTLGIILLVLAVIMLLTSIIGYCPLYTPFGFSTKSKEPDKK